MKKVEQVLDRLRSKNLAVNARKSFWAVKEVDCLGFRLTPKGVKPQARKIAALMNMNAPKTKRQLRRFIGLVNYYRYMWKGRSHLMAPLTDRTSKTMAFKWTPECQHSFHELKTLISKEVLLSFPDYTQKFVLMPDASDRQLGAVLMQNGKPLAFFSKKLNKYQQKYTVGEKEMLGVVEALKEFRTMVLGYPIEVHTDHKNWVTDKQINNARVMRWRLFIETFAPTIHYVKGEDNVVADAFSRLPFEEHNGLDDDDLYNMVEECMEMSRFWKLNRQPITYVEIAQEQLKDKGMKHLRDKATY